MRKNKILSLIGIMFIAVAGVVTVISGAQINNTESVNAENLIDVYFEDNAGFGSTIYCHNWGGDTTGTTWPGEKMTLAYTSTSNNNVYKIAIPCDRSGIIFYNYNGKQTVDITTNIANDKIWTTTDKTGSNYNVSVENLVHYNVIYDANTGTGSMDSQFVYKNDKNWFQVKSNSFTKEKYTFDSWNTKKDGTGTKYNAQVYVNPTDYSSDVTLYAQWKLTRSVYLTGDFASWARDGQYEMSNIGGTNFVLNDISVQDNWEFKVYYDETDWGLTNDVTWSHPSYKGDIHNSNCRIFCAAVYSIEYNTSTGVFTIVNKAQPTNGYSLSINGSKELTGLVKMNTSTYQSKTEYTCVHEITAGQKVKAYYQDSTSATVYGVSLQAQSIQQWEADNGSLVCPKTGEYSFWLINEGTGYDVLSIALYGESDGISFMNSFITKIGNICSTETRDLEALESEWVNQAKSFLTYNENSRALIKNAYSEHPNTSISEFAKKYDFVYKKYGTQLSLANFASRSVSSNANINSIILFNSNNNTILVVVAVSTVGLTVIGGYFFYKKRKEQ